MKEISLVFDGYWREVKKASVPEKPGIYCVYSLKYVLAFVVPLAVL